MQIPEMETITIELENGIAWIYLDRPEKLNAMNPTMFWEYETVADFVRDEPEVKVAVLTGRGRAFSAGIDLTAVQTFTGDDPHKFRNMIRRIQRNFRAFERIEKPFIAMVNGHALGAGTEIILACDFIFASTEATFGLLEVNVGLTVDLGGTQRLPRYIGIHRAKEIIMTGKKIDAAEADRIGLVNAVLPPDELKPRVTEFAEHLMSLSPVAVGLCKRLVDSSGGGIDAGLEAEAQAQNLAYLYLMEKMGLK